MKKVAVHFSSRISWSLERNRIAQAVESRGGSLLDLTQSNPTDAGIEYPAARIAAAFADERALRYDPTPFGLPAAREAVSAYYNGAVAPDRILLTASTSEAYSYLFKLLCDPGDEILVPRPSYPLFEFLAHVENVRVAHYPMHYDGGWYIDRHALKGAITPRTRAIVFVSPNNPTGSFLKQAEYAALAAFCSEHGMAMIVDEVFKDYAFGSDAERVPTTAIRDEALTFTLSGLSKVCGVPQAKLGWIVCSGPEEDRAAAWQRLELIADTFLSVGAAVQYAAPELLGLRHDIQGQIRDRTWANLQHLQAELWATAARVLHAEAGWYATVQVPRVRSEEEYVLGLIEQHGVLVQPGFFYDFESEAFLVLSLLTEPVIFCKGVEKLTAAIY